MVPQLDLKLVLVEKIKVSRSGKKLFQLRKLEILRLGTKHLTYAISKLRDQKVAQINELYQRIKKLILVLT